MDAVLTHTAELLSRDGYVALRVDDVAAASGVNKTTIYRRWPSKAELVAATLDAVRQTNEILEVGDLREDLLASMREIARMTSTPTGRGLLRILQLERAHPEVEMLARQLRTSQRSARRAMIERAIVRGELPKETNAGIAMELFYSPMFSRIVSFNEDIDDAFLVEVVDTVLAGLHARHPAALPVESA